MVGEEAGLYATDHRGLSPLHVATRGSNAAIVKCLLERRTAKEPEDEDGYTALHLASRRGRHGVVEVLLSFKFEHQPETGKLIIFTQSFVRRRYSVCSTLLDKYSDLDTASNERKIVLYYGAGLNYSFIIRTLFNSSANIDIKDMMDV